MAVDHPGLNPAPATGPRGTVLMALALLLPVLAWTAVTGREVLGHSTDPDAFIQGAARLLLLTQAMIVPLTLPWFARGPGWQGTLWGPVLLMLVPLPLLVLLGLTGEVTPGSLLLPPALLALTAMALSAGLRLLARPLRPAGRHLLQTAAGLLLTGLAWAWREIWLGWLGL